MLNDIQNYFKHDLKEIVMILVFFIILIGLLTTFRDTEKLNFVEKSTSINFEKITKKNLERGILKLENLNKTYYLYGWCELIKRDSIPVWIANMDDTTIDDIDIPFVLFKNPNESFFHVIKNKDTLTFKVIGN